MNELETAQLSSIMDKRLNEPRSCLQCILADKCPYAGMNNNTCYFDNIKNLALKNKQDLSAAMTSILSLQLDRILHMAHLERTEGGYVNKDLSEEITLFFNNVSKMKNILSSESFLKVEASGNILKELFKIGG